MQTPSQYPNHQLDRCHLLRPPDRVPVRVASLPLLPFWLHNCEPDGMMKNDDEERMPVIGSSPYRDSDDAGDHLSAGHSRTSSRTGWLNYYGRHRRRRPLLKITAIVLIVAVLGLCITSLSKPTVRAKAVEYISNLRPGNNAQLMGGEKIAHSSDEPPRPAVEESIPHSSDEMARPPAVQEEVPAISSATSSTLSSTTSSVQPAPAKETQPSTIPPVTNLEDSKTGEPNPVPEPFPGKPAGEETLIGYNSCKSVSEATISELQLVKEPTIQVISRGQQVSAGDSLAAPAPVCILIAMPQVQLPEEEQYTDAPVPGRGPDNIHLYLNSSDVILTFPPLDILHGQPDASTLHTTKSIIYQADTVLLNAGTYRIVGEREFANWFWAQEWNAEGFKFTTTTGHPPGDLFASHRFDPQPLPPASIVVSGPATMPSRPPCSDTLTAGVGRWYKQSSFPNDLAVEMADEWGYVWQGDFCHVTYFTPSDTIDCFANKNIQFFGDSMIRRLLKSVIDGGEWCHDLDNMCQDADDAPNGVIHKLVVDPTTNELTDVSSPRGNLFQQNSWSAIPFGRNSNAYFSFLTQMTNSTGVWMDRLYDASDLIVVKVWGDPKNSDAPNDREIKEGSFPHARPPPESANGVVDLVVVGFGAWDQAFTNRFDAYETRLSEFRDALIAAYSSTAPAQTKDTPIIMRMSNSWCCRETGMMHKRYTGLRIAEFDARTRKVFAVHDEDGSGRAANGRIMVLNPINMNGRADVLSDFPPSPANHPRASHVRLEMQMMLNSVCTKDATTGKMKLREA